MRWKRLEHSCGCNIPQRAGLFEPEFGIGAGNATNRNGNRFKHLKWCFDGSEKSSARLGNLPTGTIPHHQQLTKDIERGSLCGQLIGSQCPLWPA